LWEWQPHHGTKKSDKRILDDMIVYGVWAIPNPKRFYKDLPPRFQMFNDGRIAYYLTKEEAEKEAESCNTCQERLWNFIYEAREIDTSKWLKSFDLLFRKAELTIVWEKF
jgi:hypothetical protein